MKKPLCFTVGSLAFSLGFVGIFLPLLPTTPFMILAAGCFAKSSPRFHQALINNRWIGADLRRWEREGTMSRATKKRATWVIIATFSISIAILYDRHWLQLMLLGLAAVLLFFLWRVPENRSSVNS
ncbi:YbaN family protein [Thiomicrorhabdus sp. 6S3-12]|uniref:YbaN family protein n=1 Tax=Thiomicrorhabdus sp. 6S3-12 TaxID=2819681 RepID=UPI001AAD50BB|nr:YbaN family protein [Thiomicrorhabdus sp. 6S3-12]MBO1923234.1 YbaN family protein [Thiomicrorhabdus sp. 6S3-12]